MSTARTSMDFGSGLFGTALLKATREQRFPQKRRNGNPVGSTMDSPKPPRSARGVAASPRGASSSSVSPSQSRSRGKRGPPASPVHAVPERPRHTERTNELASPKTARFEKGAKVGSHSGIEDLDAFFDAYRYDPRMTRRQWRELVQEEKQREAEAKRRNSHGELRQNLLGLTGALRADMEVFINYLLDFGAKGHQLSSLARDTGAVPTRETYIQLKILFDVIDIDRSGTLTFGELERVAKLIGRGDYTRNHFSRLDDNHSGSIDFCEMIKAFYPHVPIKTIVKLHKDISKTLPTDGSLSAHDLLSPSALEEIERTYEWLSRELEGGITLNNVTKRSSKFIQERPHIVEHMFGVHQKGRDEELTLEEYREIAKFAYPPFSHAPPGGITDEVEETHELHNPLSLRNLAKKNLVDPKAMRVPRLPTLYPEEDAQFEATFDAFGRRRPGPTGMSLRNMDMLQRWSATNQGAMSSTPWRELTPAEAERTAKQYEGMSPGLRYAESMRDLVEPDQVSSLFPFSGSPGQSDAFPSEGPTPYGFSVTPSKSGRSTTQLGNSLR